MNTNKHPSTPTNTWPVYYRERLWRGNVEAGFVGVATLWTPKGRLIELLSSKAKEKIAVIGQLYSKRGCEYIFRNLWLNPKVSYLIITGSDLTQSADPLFNPEDSLWQSFPQKAVRDFFQGVKVLDWRQRQLDEVVAGIEDLEKKSPFAPKPRSFPEFKPKSEGFPSENSVFRVEGETIGEAWLQILQLILRFGRRVPRIHVYGGHERTLLNLSVVITNEDISNPKIWPFFDFDKEQLRRYFRNFFSPERGEEAYTYGERLFAYQADGKMIDQVTLMAKKLKSFPYNKGAIATLWQPQIDNFPIRKPWRTPCLTLVQGFCFQERFYLTAYFRSNDMFAAWPQNAFALRKLQTEIAKKIGKRVGDLTTISHTAFIDERDLALAERKVKENQRLFCRNDPRGILTVEVVSQEIVVRHLSPDGRKVLAEYRQDGREPKAALKLAQKLLADQVISRIGHALDIGEQLGRAEDAVKLGLKFEQDKELKVKKIGKHERKRRRAKARASCGKRKG